MEKKELKVSDRCLLFFLDETGHEEFVDPNYPIFGIGGCAVLSMYAARFMDEPWKKMKEQYFGGSSVRLHAKDVRKDITEQQMEAVGCFFRENLFSRFYSVIRLDSKISDEITPYKLLAESLLRRISIISSTHALDSIAFIFEDSERTNCLVERHFGQAEVTRDSTGEKIPLYKCFLKKSSGEIGLEVADFIIHTAGGQARQNYKLGYWKARKDYDAIFNSVPKQLISTFEILKSTIEVN